MGTMDREEEPCRPEGKTSNRRGVFSVADENAFSTFSTLNNVIRTFKKKEEEEEKGIGSEGMVANTHCISWVRPPGRR